MLEVVVDDVDLVLHTPVVLAAVASRLRRRRPLPRTALGFGDLFSGHALCDSISGFHEPLTTLTGGLRGGKV